MRRGETKAVRTRAAKRPAGKPDAAAALRAATADPMVADDRVVTTVPGPSHAGDVVKQGAPGAIVAILAADLEAADLVLAGVRTRLSDDHGFVFPVRVSTGRQRAGRAELNVSNRAFDGFAQDDEICLAWGNAPIRMALTREVDRAVADGLTAIVALPLACLADARYAWPRARFVQLAATTDGARRALGSSASIARVMPARGAARDVRALRRRAPDAEFDLAGGLPPLVRGVSDLIRGWCGANGAACGAAVEAQQAVSAPPLAGTAWERTLLGARSRFETL